MRSVPDAMNWALVADLPAAPKTLLIGLAWITNDDGATVKGQKTLAERMGKDERWVRGHLRTLADAGLLTRYERRRQDGTRSSDLIVLNIPRREPFDFDAYRGVILGVPEATGGNPPVDQPAETCAPTGGNPPGKEPPVGTTSTATPSPRAGASVDKVQLPDDFPDDLREHLKLAYVALRHASRTIPNAKPISPLSLAMVVKARPKHPIVRCAHDFASYAIGKGRARDLVAGYRNWLDREGPLAAREVLPGEEQAITDSPNVRRFPRRSGDDPEKTNILRQMRLAREEQP